MAPDSFRESLADVHFRLSGVLLPFRIESLAGVVPELGWVLVEAPERPFMARVDFSGRLASKGDLALHVSSQWRNLGVRGPHAKEVVEALNELENLLGDRLGIEAGKAADFYELQWQARLAVQGASPMRRLQAQFSDHPGLRKVEKVLGRPVTGFGYRLVPPDTEPNSTNWFDIRIEPDVLNPHAEVYVHATLRDENRKRVLETAENIERTVAELAAALGMR